MRRTESPSDYLSHFPSDFSSEIKRYATETVFLFSRYIFTRRQGKKQYGYCTHCKKDFLTPGWHHGDPVTCPECGSSCVVKASGLGRKKMIDETYFVYYEKSLTDPRTIIARGIGAVRDYRNDYRTVETQYETIALYIFKPGGSEMYHRWCYYSSYCNGFDAGQYQKTATVHSLLCREHIASIHCECSRDSIAAAVYGTPFQYSTWETYAHADMVVFFDLFSRYPCIEYLTKLGFEELVEAKLSNRHTYGAINWRGRTPWQVFRMSKKDFADLRNLQIKPSFFFLHVLQTAKKYAWSLPLSDIAEITEFSGIYFDDLKKIAAYAPIMRIISYIKKQHKQYYKLGNGGFAITDYRDYIADCIALNLDLQHERVLFPKNLPAAHRATTKQVRLKKDEITNRKIAERAQQLYKQYYFESHGLFIRPAVSIDELIAEGKALQHCVANYAGRYADGGTNILFIRQLENPDKPYFTVELHGGSLYQVRGLRNCAPGDDVNRFVTAFVDAKLDKRTRVKISA